MSQQMINLLLLEDDSLVHYNIYQQNINIRYH